MGFGKWSNICYGSHGKPTLSEIGMAVPTKLKRVKVNSDAELRRWLSRNADVEHDVMIVTCDAKSRDKHMSSADVRATLQDLGWDAGRSYTLNGNLLGHVARPHQRAA